MTLLDIWCRVTNAENHKWCVYNSNLELVAQYDGKNSIDEKYNDNLVESATITDDLALIILKEGK